MKACVDLGGTKVAVSLASDGGAAQPAPLRARRSEPTAKTGAPDAVALQILRMLAAACEEAGVSERALEAVGVSSCGPFVLKAGLIELAAPNICGALAGPARGLPNQWSSALLEAPLRERFAGLSTRLEIANDGIGALQAERRWGALQNAGHAGHMFVSTNLDALCGCGNVGDLEALVAGNAIPRRFAAQGYPDSATLLIAAKSYNTTAIAIIDALCEDMGRALYNLIVTLDLERISLGGSVFWHHRDYLLPKLKAVIHGKLPALTAGCELVPAGLGDQVGDWGALALVA